MTEQVMTDRAGVVWAFLAIREAEFGTTHKVRQAVIAEALGMSLYAVKEAIRELRRAGIIETNRGHPMIWLRVDTAVLIDIGDEA